MTNPTGSGDKPDDQKLPLPLKVVGLSGCGCVGVIGVLLVGMFGWGLWKMATKPKHITVENILARYGDDVGTVDRAIENGEPLNAETLKLDDDVLEIYRQKVEIQRSVNNSTNSKSYGPEQALYQRYSPVVTSQTIVQDVGYGTVEIDGESIDCAILVRRDGPKNRDHMQYLIFVRDTLEK